MPFEYVRPVRFHETDAAGVVYFANVLVFCHEAYEASLAAMGVDLATFFSASGLAYPITHAHVDFRRPLRCGDESTIALVPHQQTETGFGIDYQLTHGSQIVATAQTCHVCITPERKPTHLPCQMLQWIQHFQAARD